MALSPELLTLILLAELPGIGPVRLRKLLERYPGPTAAWQGSWSEWKVCQMPFSAWQAKQNLDWEQQCRQLAEELDNHGVGVITFKQGSYPELLRQTATPPVALFYQGNLELLTKGFPLALVGTRRASQEGLDLAFRFGFELAEDGLTVVSGLAIGIDGSAHRGALEAQGATVAVLGGGLGCIYPSRHRNLAHQIVEKGGLLLSEYRPTHPAIAPQFKARNRIIAGLGKGVLVVEAPARSGALITAEFALNEGREVFVLPGSVANSNWTGSNRLLREGAKLVLEVADIYEEFQQLSLTDGNREQISFVPEEARLLQTIHSSICSLDDLPERADLSWGETVYYLSQLQLRKLVVVSTDGQVRPGPLWSKVIAGLQKDGWSL